ncbi:hypothetical protein DLAC_01078 [Tieghemostelium lacteum]|uniref:Uncharacterized protein n=1 Tax=Tieghemostelium lacteum TaxID=361077 RepID=A0A152A7R5_TIELA|nr:hypothetical protein DLAC_01078 [Tieghemostelium lacteum]|eukprot:KYR02248.1 hypothetical protein DLAC_01078 [Tieghemostelium lacteum]
MANSILGLHVTPMSPMMVNPDTSIDWETIPQHVMDLTDFRTQDVISTETGGTINIPLDRQQTKAFTVESSQRSKKDPNKYTSFSLFSISYTEDKDADDTAWEQHRVDFKEMHELNSRRNEIVHPTKPYSKLNVTETITKLEENIEGFTEHHDKNISKVLCNLFKNYTPPQQKNTSLTRGYSTSFLSVEYSNSAIFFDID